VRETRSFEFFSATCIQGHREQEAAYLSGLEPDLLGEAMVLRTLAHEGKGAGAYLDRVFETAGERAFRTGFTVLGRLSEDHAEAEAWIARVLDRDVAGRAFPAFEAAKTVGERTAHSPIGKVLAKALEREGTVEIAARMEATRLPKQTVLLREVALWVTETLLAHLPEETGTLTERALLLNNMGNRQSELGMREQALASTQEAVEQYRKLSAARPDAFLPDLAGSLNNLGAMQSALGMHEDALASTQEALETIWPFFMAMPRAFANNTTIILLHILKLLTELGQPANPELLERFQTFQAKLRDIGAGEELRREGALAQRQAVRIYAISGSPQPSTAPKAQPWSGATEGIALIRAKRWEEGRGTRVLTWYKPHIQPAGCAFRAWHKLHMRRADGARGRGTTRISGKQERRSGASGLRGGADGRGEDGGVGGRRHDARSGLGQATYTVSRMRVLAWYKPHIRRADDARGRGTTCIYGGRMRRAGADANSASVTASASVLCPRALQGWRSGRPRGANSSDPP